jgi:HTH-type transcriptional regulator/antitoxin HigA
LTHLWRLTVTSSEVRPTDLIVTTGEFITDWLTYQGLDAAELTRRLDLPRTYVDSLLAGQSPLTPVLALRLARVTGLPAWRWNQIEALYREDLAISTDEVALAAQYAEAKAFPLTYLRRHGHIGPTAKTRADIVDALLTLLGVASLAGWRASWTESSVPYRRAAMHTPRAEGLATWLVLGEQAVDFLALPPYDQDGLHTMVPRQGSFAEDQAAQRIQEVAADLAEVGVAVQVVPEIPGLGVRGATRWVYGHPMVQLCPPGPAPDDLWPNLFRGLHHVLYDSPDGLYLAGPGGGAKPV